MISFSSNKSSCDNSTYSTNFTGWNQCALTELSNRVGPEEKISQVHQHWKLYFSSRHNRVQTVICVFIGLFQLVGELIESWCYGCHQNMVLKVHRCCIFTKYWRHETHYLQHTTDSKQVSGLPLTSQCFLVLKEFVNYSMDSCITHVKYALCLKFFRRTLYWFLHEHFIWQI